MKVFFCTDHNTVYPVGGASVVTAEDEVEAKQLLSKALRDKGLDDEPFTLQELDLSRKQAIILNDGEY